MRVGVTGAAGRVGQVVARLLVTSGHTVVGIDRAGSPRGESACEIVEADTRRYEELLKALDGCDAVVHLAAHPSPRARPGYEVHNDNVTSSYNVLCAAAELGIRRLCQASSVNAVGAAYSRAPHFDYFPVDELHPTYNEDPYSLSKWICEEQADSLARLLPDMTIASLRLHAVVASRSDGEERLRQRADVCRRDLWGYTTADGAARACLAALEATYRGHERFFVVADRTCCPLPSLRLRAEYYAAVPLRGDLPDNRSFFDSSKAANVLGWRDEE
jgi:nucleoside-diphosphate-sugar epimerase